MPGVTGPTGFEVPSLTNNNTRSSIFSVSVPIDLSPGLFGTGLWLDIPATLQSKKGSFERI